MSIDTEAKRVSTRVPQRRARFSGGAALLAVVLAVIFAGVSAHASVALLLEEPYGQFGAINPTGHAAVYLSHVCADAPTRLRMCAAREYGAVISRYYKIDGYDWIAMPLIPYLYASDTPAEVPSWVDSGQVANIRDAYRRAHLESLAPDGPGGSTPSGEWTQLDRCGVRPAHLRV